MTMDCPRGESTMSTEDWIVKRGDLFLVAPHWIIWDTKPALVCRFTHERAAVSWCSLYNDSGYATEDGPPEAVAVYDGSSDTKGPAR